MAVINAIIIIFIVVLMITTFVYSAKYNKVSHELADAEIERDSLKEEFMDLRTVIDKLTLNEYSTNGDYEIEEQKRWLIPSFAVMRSFVFCGKTYSVLVKSFLYFKHNAESRAFARREAEELLAALNERVTWQDDIRVIREDS